MMTEGSLIEGSQAAIEKDFLKLIIQPFKQLCDRLSELFRGESTYDFSGVDEIHLVVVNLFDFPTLKPMENKLKDYIKSIINDSPKEGPLYHPQGVSCCRRCSRRRRRRLA